MSYDKVQTLRIVSKGKDGYAFKGRFAASNVFPITYESTESYKRWSTREEVDTALAWHFWNGNFQGGRTEWSVRNDIARLFHKRAGVQDLPVEEWRDNRSDYQYGTRISIMENTVFPAAHDVWLRWKTTPGKFAIVDDEAFVSKITTRRGGTTIHRRGKPTYWNAQTAGLISARIALNAGGFSREFKRISDVDIESVVSELGDGHIPYYKLASRCFDSAPVLFEPEWEYAVKRFPDLLTCGDKKAA